ncbi:MAG: hypothetical protein K0S78_2727 [Thermomicrobiales bacterium]|jgi:hypothetical protein|nr:hypothetical protein [Thermomicrobiales bacterium]MDF3041244.1 hypothetical protein [Thermomicrobiales bacterium]
MRPRTPCHARCARDSGDRLLLAVVLFFAGVCTKIGWRPAQLALLGLSLLLLLYCVRVLGALPVGSDWGLTPRWE